MWAVSLTTTPLVAHKCAWYVCVGNHVCCMYADCKSRGSGEVIYAGWTNAYLFFLLFFFFPVFTGGASSPTMLKISLHPNSGMSRNVCSSTILT